MLSSRSFKSASTAALAAVVLTSSAAYSEEYTPVEIMPASPVRTGGRPADILGISPGMKCSEALDLLKRAYREEAVRTQHQRIQTSYKGLEVSTTPFLTEISVAADNEGTGDSIGIYCSGIAGGNQVVMLNRRLSFGSDPLDAPSVADLERSLIEKYGPQSADADRATGFYWHWIYKDEVQIACNPRSYDCVSDSVSSYSPQMFSNWLNDRSSRGIVITGKVEPSYDDRMKGAYLSVQVTDVARRNDAARADYDSLMAEAVRQHGLKSVSGAIPKL